MQVDAPKKGRKRHEHAFRVDLATKDSEKVQKYIIAVSNASELKDWMACFGAYSSMTVEDVEQHVTEAMESAAKLLRMSQSAQPGSDDDSSDAEEATGVSIKEQAALNAARAVDAMKIPTDLFQKVSFSGVKYGKKKVRVLISVSGLKAVEDNKARDTICSHGLPELSTWKAIGKKQLQVTIRQPSGEAATAGAEEATLVFETKQATELETSLTELADKVAVWKKAKQKSLAASEEAKAMRARNKTNTLAKAGKVGGSRPSPRASSVPQQVGSDAISVICPDGVGPGDWIVVDAPDGRELEAQVPPGIQAGMEFSVALLPPRPTASKHGRIVTALHGWNEAAGADPAAGDLLFEAGTAIEILSESSPGGGWFTGRAADGREGSFPANYLSSD